MKTLSDFKRNIKVGTALEYVLNLERAFDQKKNTHSGKWHETEIPERIRGLRHVSVVNSTGFYLKKFGDETMSRGSFCGWPKAGDLEYSGNSFAITDRAKDGEAYQIRHYKIVNN